MNSSISMQVILCGFVFDFNVFFFVLLSWLWFCLLCLLVKWVMGSPVLCFGLFMLSCVSSSLVAFLLSILCIFKPCFCIYFFICFFLLATFCFDHYYNFTIFIHLHSVLSICFPQICVATFMFIPVVYVIGANQSF